MTDVTIAALIILTIGIVLIAVGVFGLYQKSKKSKHITSYNASHKTPVDPSIVEKIRNDEQFKKQIKAIIDKKKEEED